VGDQQNAFAVPVASEVSQEVPSAVDDLAIALTAGERQLDAAGSVRVQSGDGCAVEIAGVALAKAGVLGDRYAGVAEGDPGCLDGAREVGREDGVDAIVPAPTAEVSSVLAAGGG
jgi:hypothetical protein